MAKFDPDKITAYRLARQHTQEVHRLIAQVQKRGHADLINQFRRSATSISANILESVGDSRPGKRLNYLMIAKGSTFESWAHTDSLLDLGLVQASAVTSVRDLQNRLTGVLIVTIRNLESVIAANPAVPPFNVNVNHESEP